MDTRTVNEAPKLINPDFLADFIDQLRDAGYNIGVSQYVAAQKLILALIDQEEALDSPDRLGSMLGPIFCSSATEQNEFPQRWIDFLNNTHQLPVYARPEVIGQEDSGELKAQALSEELEKIGSGSRQLKRIAFLSAIGAIVIFLPMLMRGSTHLTPSRSIKPLVPKPSPLPKPSDSVKPSPLPKPSDSAKPTPLPKPSDSVKPTPLPKSSDSVKPTPLPKPSDTVKLTITPKVNISNNSRLFFFGRQSVLIVFVILSIVFSVLFMIWRLWWLRRAHLFLQRLGVMQEPELQKVSIREYDHYSFPRILFTHVARGLKRRVRIPSNELDVNKTIETTLRRGGWFSPVYSTYQTPMEYLFLIDRASFRDHQTRWVDEMIEFLKQDGVFISKFYFEGNPLLCFSEVVETPPKKLSEIKNNFNQNCLIIVSDAHIFFNAIDGELVPWLTQFESWKKRVVLTPSPIGNWVFHEFILAQQFIVLPATSQGLHVLSQVLNPDFDNSYILSEERKEPLPEQLFTRSGRWLDRDPPALNQVEAMLKLVEKYLGRVGFYWFCACAVFPELHWDITLYLGYKLKMIEGVPLLEKCESARIARLPWFRYAYMPDWLRIRLILTLTPAQNSDIREALQDLVITSIQGTATKPQLEVAQHFHQVLPALVNPILRLLSRRSAKDSPFRDYLFLCFMHGQPLLASRLPEEFRYLLKERNPFKSFSLLSLSESTIVILVVLTITLSYLKIFQRQRVEQLAANAQVLLTSQPVNAEINAIAATGLSQSVLVQFPDSPYFSSVEGSLLDVTRENSKRNRLLQKDIVNSVTFSPDGNRIVSGSRDRTLRVWDASTGQPIGKPLVGHEDWVSSVAFSPDGKRIVSGSRDKTLRMWDASTGQPIGKPLVGHEDWVSSVAFSPDGKRIVSGSIDKTLRVWDVSTGQPIGKPFEGQADVVTSVAFSPDGKRIVSGSRDKTIRMWDASTGQPILSLFGHEGWVNSVAFSPDGKRVVSGSSDNTVRVWDESSGQPIGQPFQGHEFDVYSVAFSSDGKRIVSGSWDKTVRVWDVSSGQPIGKPFQGHKSYVNSVAFSPDGKRVVSGSSDNTVRVWDESSGQPIGQPIGKPYQGQGFDVYSVAFSPDVKRIVSGRRDSTFWIWDASTGQPIGNPFVGHEDWVSSVAFSPDGKRIVSGSRDKTLRMWDASAGQPIGKPFVGHEDWVSSVAFSPDGKRIVSGSSDNTVRVWDASSGQPIGSPFQGHEQEVSSVAFSPDGRRIVSGSRDKTLRMWDASTGQPIGKPLVGHEDWVSSVAFSPDGKRIVSGSRDNTVRVWDIDWRYSLQVACTQLSHHPSLTQPTTDVAKEAKQTCQEYVGKS
jgi:WD40 repeat protein